jgi:hypothetical protein
MRICLWRCGEVGGETEKRRRVYNRLRVYTRRNRKLSQMIYPGKVAPPQPLFQSASI